MKMNTIAVAGNPNSGKTTVFNLLTGSNQKVGNWPGVTVDKKEGRLKLAEDEEVALVDLPGIYSLSASSEDEFVASRFLLNEKPDLVIQVIDSTNLERNLYLTIQLMEMGLPLLVILNMEDLAQKNGISLEAAKLAHEMNIDVISMSGNDKSKLPDLKRLIKANLGEGPESSPKAWNYPKVHYSVELQEEVNLLAPALHPISEKQGWDPQWLAMKLLEGDDDLEKRVVKSEGLRAEDLDEARKRVSLQTEVFPDELLAESRYALIEKMLRDSGHFRGEKPASFSDKLDAVFLHKFLGLPSFMLVMYLVFWLTINLGGAFIDFFDIAFGAIFVDGFGEILNAMGAPEWVVTILADGVGAGIQTLSTFFPIIFVLFLIISFLESSGYMSRAAFVMDRLMRFMGLPGKAFIPMLVGFGCTVPAIMATRALESRRDRVLSVFMVPFMSCGARLPVYVLFAAAFFPGSGQNLVFGLYLVGVVLAILTGLLLKNTVYRGTVTPFIMELSPYHTPRPLAMIRSAWLRLYAFIRKGGRVLIPIIAVLGVLNTMSVDGTFGHEDSEQSVLSVIGKAVTPVFEPMGVHEDNWPAAVGLFTGLFAKEIIVGTLNSIYSQEMAKSENLQEVAEEEDAFDFWGSIGEAFVSIPQNLAGLTETLTDPLGIAVGDVADEEKSAGELDVDAGLFATMRGFFNNSSAAAIAYLLFVLLYIPCVVAVSASWKEVGAAITLLQMYFATVLGWSLSTITFQVLEGHSTEWILASVIILLVSVIGILVYAVKSRSFEDK